MPATAPLEACGGYLRGPPGIRSAMKNMFRIALAQVNPTVGDFAGNLALHLARIEQARAAGASLVAFPELALAGYPPEDLLFKPSFIEAGRTALETLAASLGEGPAVITGFIDRDENGLYNACAIIARGRLRAVCRKRELPNYGVFDEKRYFRAGYGNALLVQDGVVFGVNICEDIWHRQGPMRAQAGAGAQFIVNISASPYERGKIRRREEMLSGRASENGVFLFFANLVGGQDELVFDGSSAAFDPTGRVFARAASFEEDLLVASFDPGAVRRTGRESVGKKTVVHRLPPGLKHRCLKPRKYTGHW